MTRVIIEVSEIHPPPDIYKRKALNMSYYVSTLHCDAMIPDTLLNDAYKAMCALNAHHDKKLGGVTSTYRTRTTPEQSNSVSDNPNKWYSWMSWNYDEICNSAQEILEMLGFDTQINGSGLFLLGYDNKSGQENLFLAALAPYLVSAYGNGVATIDWRDEYGAEWRWAFKNGKMVTYE